jgi:hypothetical protein
MLLCRKIIIKKKTKMDQKDANRYVFGLTGTVREIIYPSKAILAFRFNGKDEKAILLVHKLLLADGGGGAPVAVDEHRLMSDLVKVGDILEFDGHVYDKGGYGAGKDKCNYYVMRAWKACQSKLISRVRFFFFFLSSFFVCVCDIAYPYRYHCVV